MRTISIDVIRGIAILGILLMNIPFHFHIELGYVPFPEALTSDRIMTGLYTVFADGRFRTLFSLLFGAGLAIQYESCKRKNIDTNIFLKSRLYWLFLFGVFHGIFIFGGDILMLYSVTGLLFIKGLSLELNKQLEQAKKFLTIGAVLAVIFGVIAYLVAGMEDDIFRGSPQYNESIMAWNGQYLYQTMVNALISLAMLMFSPVFILWQILGLMYLGSYLYSTGFFSEGFNRATLLKISLLAALTTAMCAAPQFFLSTIDAEVVSTFSSISAVFVALLYAHIIVKLCNSAKPWLRYLVAPGKVAFSLYILQSVSMGILLRVVIPQFHLTATLFDYFIIVCGFTLIQIGLANVYLRFFDQGPLEYIWRKAYSRSVLRKTNEKLVNTGNVNE